jgi:DNA helicase HerA-like ATPase
MKDKFIKDITEGYTFKGDSVVLGAAMFEDTCLTNTLVKVPLKTINRHGLIAGATGTGKTKTLQVFAEQLAEQGVPSLLMDVKGDLSGIATEGKSNSKIEDRHNKLGFPFEAGNSTVELLSLSEEKGVRLRATVTEFGPVLFSKILDLNETQESIISVLFKYCDDNQLPLLDLEDFKKVLHYMINDGKESVTKEYGAISTSSVGTILRKVIQLEQQGADMFFGEPSFDVNDFCRIDENGRGVISIIRLCDIQDKPLLFSTFMLQILAEIYAVMPEEGDLDRPKLVLFIDEAHLVFEEATDALLDQIEVIIKLIRSKGIGVFFITQNPDDIPEDVLGQLGLKIQHALRAFTAKDRKAIKMAAENFPISGYYQTDELLTSMGIGEAIVTALNEKGIPTPLVHTMLRAPKSRMDMLEESEIDELIDRSTLIKKYNTEIDRRSAYEILSEKIDIAQEKENQEKLEEQKKKAEKAYSGRREKSTFEKVLNSSATRQVGRTLAREITRGLLGALGVKTTASRRTRKRKTSSAFNLLFG